MRHYFSLLLFVFCMANINKVQATCRETNETLITPAAQKMESRPREALEIINEGITKLKAITLPDSSCKANLGKAYLIKGIILGRLDQYPEAKTHLEQALEIRRYLKDKKGVSSVYNNYFDLEKRKGNFSIALKYINKAISYLRDSTDINDGSPLIGIYLTNKASIYIELEEYDQAELLISQAKTILSQYDDGASNIIAAEYNLALARLGSSQFEKAEDGLRSCLNFYAEQQDTFNVAMVRDALGTLYSNMGAYEKAKSEFEKSVQLYSSLDNKAEATHVYANLSQNYLRQKKPNEAIKIANQINVDSIENPFYKIVFCNICIDAYDALGQDMEVEKYIDKLVTYYINDELPEKMYPDPGLNDFYNPLKHLNILKTYGKRYLTLKQRKQTIAIIWTSLLFVLLVVLFVRWIITYFKKRTQKQVLIAESKALEQAFQEKITTILKNYVDDEYKDITERDRLIHDEICPRIISIKREMEFFLTKRENSIIKDAIKLTDGAYEKTRKLIVGKIPPIEETEWIQNINLLIEQQKRINAYELNYFIDVNPDEIPRVVGSQIAIITNVLLENIEKHAWATNASIDLIKENGSIIMLIEDDGVGFNKDSIKTNQNNNSNSGIGLKNVKHRVEEILGGSIKIESREGRGTTITIFIPIEKN